jgi:hypothetical protein
MQRQIDHSTLEMALVGYEAELQKIEGAMAAIRKQLGVRGSGARVMPAGGNGAKAKHQMSAAGRKHIADAQKKRWAAYHAKHNKPAVKAAAKRKMSPERKAALVANLAKARAARAAKKAAATA